MKNCQLNFVHPYQRKGWADYEERRGEGKKSRWHDSGVHKNGGWNRHEDIRIY